MSQNFLDAEKYTRICLELTPKIKGGDIQREFLHNVSTNNGFVRWYEAEMGAGSIDGLQLFREKFTKNMFGSMPIEIEFEIYKLWKDKITPAKACSNSFWSRVTYMHIQKGILSSVDLAANGSKNDSGGKGIIDMALKENHPGKIDNAVRTILRRLGGLRSERGRRSIYTNCPFARAWWRVRYASEISEHTALDMDMALDVLRRGRGGSDGFWASLIEQIVSGNSTLGYKDVRNALVWKFHELHERESTGTNLVKYFKELSRLCCIQELGIYTVEELKNIIERMKIKK